jgi:hypothetical protein
VTEAAPTAEELADSPAVVGGRSLYLPLPPTFETVEEERAHRKAKLAAAFRMFSKAGLTRAWPVTSPCATPSSRTPTG